MVWTLELFRAFAQRLIPISSRLPDLPRPVNSMIPSKYKVELIHLGMDGWVAKTLDLEPWLERDTWEMTY